MNWMDIVKNARLRNGLKQDALAAYLGVDQGTVSRWERGTSSPTVSLQKSVLDKLEKLAPTCSVLFDLMSRVSTSAEAVLLSDAGSFATKAASSIARDRLRFSRHGSVEYNWHESPKTVQQENVYGTVTNGFNLFHDRTIIQVDAVVALSLPDGTISLNHSSYIPVWIDGDRPRLLIIPKRSEQFLGQIGSLSIKRATEPVEILEVRNE
ncbi:XRE family transcriptional regulator [Roseobacter phage DSS3P8]|nr:XRE family transcriptional regulator [Roseobacter phage DSS3P8]